MDEIIDLMGENKYSIIDKSFDGLKFGLKPIVGSSS